MKKNNRVIAAGIFGAFILLLVTVSIYKSDPKDLATPSFKETSKEQQVARSQSSPSSEQPVSLLQGKKKIDPEQATGLENLVSILADAVLFKHNIDSLMTTLETLKQSPYKATDSNPYTGDMTIIRTKSPWPGTRYFHAQYFTDENRQSYPQHLSFEFKPGEKSFAEVQKVIREILPGLSEPSIQKEKFIQWELHNGYVIWVKVLEQRDLEPNPYDAYTTADVGTVRVAVELSPHDDGDEHQHK
jgi:hypothetical protein